MTERLSASAACLCGAVEMSISNVLPHMEACHCSMCRKWGGGPMLGMDCSELELSGDDHVGLYDSSDWAQRGFCTRCGTHLFYKLKDQEHYFVPAGFFQQLEALSFREEIFFDQKPAYYNFANETEKLTGEETFAKYAAQDGG